MAAKGNTGRRLLVWLLAALIAAIALMLIVAILLVHPSLLIFVAGALVPAAIPFALSYENRMFLAWSAGTVTVAAIAPIVTGGLFDPNRAVHTEMRSWLIALGAAGFGYAIALVSPWLGERVALARQKLNEIKVSHRRQELIEIWTESRLRKPASARAVVGKDFVAEEEAAEGAADAPPGEIPADAKPEAA